MTASSDALDAEILSARFCVADFPFFWTTFRKLPKASKSLNIDREGHRNVLYFSMPDFLFAVTCLAVHFDSTSTVAVITAERVKIII